MSLGEKLCEAVKAFQADAVCQVEKENILTITICKLSN